MKGLMDRIGETVKGRIAEAELSPRENEIRKYILREFARNGSPPALREIMDGLGIPSEEIVNQTLEKLQKADILSRKGNEIISAYPFSAGETHHKVVFRDGNEVYALCATDALGIHFMLNEDITVLSRCPRCRREMRIVVERGRIVSHLPEGIIEFVSNREGDGCTAETICPFINFFCSREHLEEWREGNPEHENGEIYSLNEALEHGKTIFGGFMK